MCFLQIETKSSKVDKYNIFLWYILFMIYVYLPTLYNPSTLSIFLFNLTELYVLSACEKGIQFKVDLCFIIFLFTKSYYVDTFEQFSIT